MSDDTLFYWGMVVTMFLFLAALLTARELFERYVDDDEDDSGAAPDSHEDGLGSNR